MSTAEIYRLYLLPPGARPQRHQVLSWQSVEQHRHLECPWYSGCLRFVARIPWPGFTCRACPLGVPKRRPAGTSTDKLPQLAWASKASGR